MVYVPFRFLGHTVKGQGQSAGVWKNVCTIYWPLCLKDVTVDAQGVNYHYSFSGHIVKGQGQIAGFWKKFSSIFFAGKFLNLIQWMPLASI